MTKLLLGAGLVSLTHLGPPIGGLITNVGRGLQSARPNAPTGGPATIMAGAIIFCYLTLGFLFGYIVTTTWYQRLLEKVVDKTRSG